MFWQLTTDFLKLLFHGLFSLTTCLLKELELFSFLGKVIVNRFSKYKLFKQLLRTSERAENECNWLRKLSPKSPLEFWIFFYSTVLRRFPLPTQPKPKILRFHTRSLALQRRKKEWWNLCCYVSRQRSQEVRNQNSQSDLHVESSAPNPTGLEPNQLPSLWPHDPHNLTQLWFSSFFSH